MLYLIYVIIKQNISKPKKGQVEHESKKKSMMEEERSNELMNDFLTVQQVATLYGVSPKTIRRYIHNEKLEALKFGATWRISRDALDRFLKSNSSRTEKPK